MVLTRYKVFVFLQLLFLLNIFYWAPFISVEILSFIKFIILIFVLLLSFAFLSKIKFNKFFLIMFLTCIFLFFLYESFSSGDGEYLKTGLIISIFYILGYIFSGYSLKNNFKFPVIIFTLACLWVILSVFIPALDYKNSLMLDYTFEDVLLSSTGFSIARTSWGLSAFLLCMYFYHSSKSNKIKFLAFIVSMISVFLLATRGGMLYYNLALIFIIYQSNIKLIYKNLISIFLMISLALIYYKYGDLLRLSNKEDISTGRFEHYSFFYVLFKENYWLGTYSNGLYDLTKFGLSVSKVHNAFLNLLLKYGILGAIPFFILLVYSIYKILNNYYKNLKYLYILLIGGILSCLLEPDSIFSYGYHVLIFWFVLAYCTFYKESKING